jgi:hypothetical protein
MSLIEKRIGALNMNSKLLGYLVLLLFGVFLVQSGVYAEAKQGTKKSPAKVNGSPTRTYLDINKIATQFTNDGKSDLDNSGNSAFVYPAGSGKTAVFESGFLWGAYGENDTLKVGGSAYGTGLQGGRITNSGLPYAQLTVIPADDPSVRLYRVRADIYPSGPEVDLTKEATWEGISASDMLAQYLKDWNEWPATDGAPTWVDTDGVYGTKMAVIPGVRGADQTIWFVANDLNQKLTTGLYGTTPLGIEYQATYWAYNQSGALGNMIFRKYKIINKSNLPFKNMIVSMFSDIDDGNATDDYAGCDTLLSLGYCYNANATDATYSPLPPPAVGFDFFQGPKVPGVNGQDVNGNGVNDAIDYATVDGKKVGPGYVNLPMTAFYYFANGDANVTDPTIGSKAGATQFYNFFQGKVGLTGNYFVDPTTGLNTTFVLTGDPQKHTGWVDGMVLSSGDRRIGLASGPFTMAVGDTQEIVVSEIAAGAITGVDRLSAIGLLKFYDEQAQSAYDNNFDLPTAPPAPFVKVTSLDKEIILNWDNSVTAVAATENFSKKGHVFQGYNVYQLPTSSSDKSEGKLIATYDIVDGIGKIEDKYFDSKTGVVATGVQQFGNDNGVKRYIDLTADEINGGTPLINGIRYYFAVTSYSYSATASVVNNLETPLDIITVVPHANNPGVSLYTATGTKITNVTHATGTGDATVFYVVTDPTKTVGGNYKIGFSTQPDLLTASAAGWYTGLTGEASIVLSEDAKQVDYSVSITGVDSLGTLSGVGIGDANTGAINKTIKLTNATVLSKLVGSASGSWKSSDTTEPFTPALETALVSGGLAFLAFGNADTLFAPISISTYPWYLDRGTTHVLSYQHDLKLDEAYQTVEGIQPKIGSLTFAFPMSYAAEGLTEQGDPNEKWPLTLMGDGATVFGYASGHNADFYGGGDSCTVEDYQQDLEFRWTGVAASNESPVTSGGSMAIIRSRSAAAAQALVRVPFEIWEVERNRQIMCVITDRNVDALSPWGDRGIPQYYRLSGREYISVIARAYDTTVAKTLTRTDSKATWALMFKDSADYSKHPYRWHTGDKYYIKYANPIIPGSDTYTFSSPAPTAYSKAKAKEDVKNINVFPNPYYGVNSEELNKYNRFVTFSHLPSVAKIRVFNLAGVLVKTIEHNSDSQFERWDLANQNGLPVASGLYIAYIDMPDLGVTKTLKVAIIQEQQILDRF